MKCFQESRSGVLVLAYPGALTLFDFMEATTVCCYSYKSSFVPFTFV